MSTNTQSIKIGDKVKIVSTECQLSEIGASGEYLKGKIATVIYMLGFGIAVKFKNGEDYYLRFKDVHKVVE